MDVTAHATGSTPVGALHEPQFITLARVGISWPVPFNRRLCLFALQYACARFTSARLASKKALPRSGHCRCPNHLIRRRQHSKAGIQSDDSKRHAGV